MKRFVGYVIDKAIKAIPRKKKVSPTIKSVKPTKDIKGSIKRTKRDAFSKNIDDLMKAEKKVNVGTDLKNKRDFQDSITKRRDEILIDYKITDQKQKIDL